MKQNFSNWTRADIEKLRAEGRVREHSSASNRKVKNVLKDIQGNKIPAKHFESSKEKEFIRWNLWYWCNEHVVLPEEEFVFDEKRGWRFDYAIPALKWAIEYEGGIFMEKSGHSNYKGLFRDITKYNSAQAQGWKVIRLCALNYKDLITELNKLV